MGGKALKHKIWPARVEGPVEELNKTKVAVSNNWMPKCLADTAGVFSVQSVHQRPSALSLVLVLKETGPPFHLVRINIVDYLYHTQPIFERVNLSGQMA
jgi:hypothetical protein